MSVDSKLPILHFAIPIHNEESQLNEKLDEFLKYYQTLLGKIINQDSKVIMAENGSTDNTFNLLLEYSKDFDFVKILHDDYAGKGKAIKLAWQNSTADLLGFSDLDFAVPSKFIPIFIAQMKENDLLIASRNLPDSNVSRSIYRGFLSKINVFLTQNILNIPFSDFNCGFKFIKNAAWKSLELDVVDTGFFFDTEILFYAKKANLIIREIPVEWREGEYSTVNTFKTSYQFIINLIKLKRSA